MPWLSPTQITRLKARIARWEAYLAAYDAAVLSGAIEQGSYRFDSGEGSQQVKYRSYDEMMKAIRIAETTLEHLHQKLSGAGISVINLRRQTGHAHNRGYCR